MSKQTKMAIDLRVGDVRQLVLPDGQRVDLCLQKKSGQYARVEVRAPDTVRIVKPDQA